MKKVLLFIFGLFMVFTIASCSKTAGVYDEPDKGYDGYHEPPSAGYDDMISDKDEGGMSEGGTSGVVPGDGGTSSEAGEGSQNSNLPQAGQLTCSVYDDNHHYAFLKNMLLIQSYQFAIEDDLYNLPEDIKTEDDFKKYCTNYYNVSLHFNNLIKVSNSLKRLLTRIKVETNLNGALMELYKDNSLVQKGYTLNDGKGYLYVEGKSEYQIKFILNDVSYGPYPVTEDAYNDGMKFDFEEPNNKVNTKIDIMFVVDTTGSMGDELNYLNSEVISVIDSVKETNAGVDIRVALLFYRDQSDEYVTRYFDFSDNMEEVNTIIGRQRAGGGGDYEEAVQDAMNLAKAKDWRDGDCTKLLFHIADAPSHDEDVESWMQSALDLSEKGVRVIPVASSGINKEAELLFRAEAAMTGGTYMYLTNHSGIGGFHIAPTIEERQTVEYLNKAMVRVINGYHTGTFLDPIPYNQQ